MELKKISKDIGNCSVDDLLRNLKQYNHGVCSIHCLFKIHSVT